MTEITEKQIEHLAELSALELSSEEKNKMKTDIGNILNFADTVVNVQIDDDEAKTRYVTLDSLREDIPMPGLTNEEALQNAPKKDGGYYVVSKVVD